MFRCCETIQRGGLACLGAARYQRVEAAAHRVVEEPRGRGRAAPERDEIVEMRRAQSICECSPTETAVISGMTT
jgi:hypothetical protein